MRGQQPEAGQLIFLRIYRFGPLNSSSALMGSLQTTTDASGRFEFDRVPPGEWEMGRAKIYKRQNFRMHEMSHNETFDLDSGEILQVQIGGQGFDIKGKVEVTQGDAAKINWTQDPHALRLKVIEPNAPVPPQRSVFENEKDFADAMQDYSKIYQEYVQSEAAIMARKARKSYILEFEEDGRFIASDVPAGEYTLQIRPMDQTQDNLPFGRPLGNFSQDLVVPPVGHPEDEKLIDLGVLKLELR